MDPTAGSGDLTADRRFELARQFGARGDHGAAADLIRQALELAPDWTAGWFGLGQSLAKAGQGGAAAAFRRCLALDTGDAMGAGLELALLGEARPDGMPDAYVRALFDDYAPRFDAALRDRLHYRAPALVRRTIDRVRPGPVATLLDLGCGTGLSGAAFAGVAVLMDGIDLSPAMIAEAARKDIYATLTVGEIRAFLASCAAVYDIVISVDTLIYLGRLDDVFASVRRVVRPGGVFCFTVQAQNGDGDDHGYALGADHRYSYGEAYLHGAASGWEFAALEPCVLRQDAGRDVKGLVCALR